MKEGGSSKGVTRAQPGVLRGKAAHGEPLCSRSEGTPVLSEGHLVPDSSQHPILSAVLSAATSA